MNSRSRPVALIGEDDPADRDLIRRTLSNGPVDFELVSDGSELIEYIESTVEFQAGLQIPDLVIMDLNMPRLNGKQVLLHLRNIQLTRKIPVVVFSSSNRATDIAECYDAGCASYIVKPMDLEPFMGAVNLVVAYWLELVEPVGALRRRPTSR